MNEKNENATKMNLSPDHHETDPSKNSKHAFLLIARMLSILGALGIWFLPPAEGLSASAQSLASVTFLMATLWMTEAAPIIFTSLLPIVLFPLLQISDFSAVLPVYVKDLIWLFFGGFQLAFAVERCGLHKRMAMTVLRAVGTEPKRVVLGFMLASGLLSMWLFNTSTTLMLLPVAMAVVHQLDEKGTTNLGSACMLGLAYAASIGGTGTYLGTAPNGVFREQALTFGTEISFGTWIMFAMPLSLLLILIVWLFLTSIALPIKGVGQHDLTIVGLRRTPWSRVEKKVCAIFVVTVCLWLSRGYISGLLDLEKGVLTDGRIALTATSLLLFFPTLNPAEKLLTLGEIKKTPWSILILFGGGFAIAHGFQTTGLSMWLGAQMKVWVAGWPLALVILSIVLMVTFLTEITSNTATANVLLPVIGSLAIATDTPAVLLMLPATLAASCAFMMPVATPPNAIVYGSGLVSIKRMASVGFGVNLITTLAITFWILTWGKLVLPL